MYTDIYSIIQYDIKLRRRGANFFASEARKSSNIGKHNATPIFHINSYYTFFVNNDMIQ